MIRVRQVKVLVEKNSDREILSSLAKKLRLSKDKIINYIIRKQSLDARNKEEIYYVYELDVELDKKQEEFLLRNKKNIDISSSFSMKYVFEKTGKEKMKNRPIVVGSGPCGLLCAYVLAENGYKPIIIERGEMIDDRIKTVSLFWENGKLNKESNVQFGEGGAGTFSDGKLNTLVKDLNNRGRKVFETFVECGAPKEILYSYKPHIGTDLLVDVIRNMRKKIIKMGGEFRYSSLLTDIKIEDNKLSGIVINNKEHIDCEVLVLAIGHSARDTFSMLLSKNIEMEAKPFAVGIRVQHLQDDINNSQYGKKYKDILGNASYKLTYKASNDRGVYSFCMCPGGYVVNASSEDNRLAINGMSNHKRDSNNANSAIVVTVSPKDFGNNPLDGMNFQRELEEKAYKIGNGNIPVQLLKDFKENRKSSSFGQISPIFKGSYQFADLNQILPDFICSSLKEAFPYFETKIKGFDIRDAILSAVESRTSSPVRIIRNDEMMSNVLGIYPSGEGAGYAGGITSAAIDGIKVAEAIGRKYQ